MRVDDQPGKAERLPALLQLRKHTFPLGAGWLGPTLQLRAVRGYSAAVGTVAPIRSAAFGEGSLVLQAQSHSFIVLRGLTHYQRNIHTHITRSIHRR